MPTFKDKTGKPRFAMNPQVGKSLFGGPPGGGGNLGAEGPPGGGPLGDESQVPGLGGDDTIQDSIEVHHGSHPDGQPPPSETTTHHTIHKGPDDQPKEIANHESYEDAESHMRECMGEAEKLNDMGASDLGGESQSEY